MKIHDYVSCKDYPCIDVNHQCYQMPDIDVDPNTISIILISEAAPSSPQDGYYAENMSLFQQTTIQAFQDAGAKVSSIADILESGIYLTTAVKCGKTTYGIQTRTIETCSCLLEQELALFPGVKAYLLMGDVAIKAVNMISKRAGEQKVIPTGSTYKIRNVPYYWRGRRVFPSYLQAGPSFFIEKSKRKMIAEDLRAALDLLN